MRTISLIVVLLCFVTIPVQAADEPFVQDIDPARVKLDETLPKEPSLHLAPKIDATDQLDTTKAAPRPTTSGQHKFMLRGLKIQGAYEISAQELIKPFQHKFGQQVSLPEVLTIAEAMTIKYRSAGYILARVLVPPQTVSNGIVTLIVFEGKVANVFITGDKLPTNLSLLRKYGAQITKQQTLHIATIERYALLINRIPGISAKMVLSPAKEQAGAADLTILVTEHKNLDALVQFDNKISKKDGHQQVTGVIYVNNAAGGGKTGFIIKNSTNVNRLTLFAVSHEQLVGADGLAISIYGHKVETNPKFIQLPLLTTKGNSKNLILTFNYPVLLSRRHALSTHVSFDMDSSTAENNVYSSFHDEIRSIRLGVSYEFVDKFKGSNVIDVQYSQGLKAFGATKTKHDAAIEKSYSRVGGCSDYTKFNINAQRLQFLPQDFSILFSLNGQYSLHELLSSEEYGFGGPRMGRGYEAARLTGEHGIAGQIEFRRDFTIPNRYLQKCQIYAAYDLGVVWNKRGQKIIINGEPCKRGSAASASFGLRTVISKSVNFEIELAKPLTLPEKNNKKETRLFFNLIYRY